jgi:hypothetical protein
LVLELRGLLCRIALQSVLPAVPPGFPIARLLMLWRGVEP